jgi:hypothetical protein
MPVIQIRNLEQTREFQETIAQTYHSLTRNTQTALVKCSEEVEIPDEEFISFTQLSSQLTRSTRKKEIKVVEKEEIPEYVEPPDESSVMVLDVMTHAIDPVFFDDSVVSLRDSLYLEDSYTMV